MPHMPDYSATEAPAGDLPAGARSSAALSEARTNV